MAKILRVLKTLRNNWKKTVFFSSLAGYGIKWVISKHNDELLRRAYCSEALKLGIEKVTLTQRPIKVVVFLNPAAKTGDARKLFEKNSAPLLYLAGFEVNVVKTEYEGQAKEFVTVLEMKDVDKIVVAGGDGTLNEVITGIMKKKDRNFEKNIPIGIIPLGSTNRFAHTLFGEGLDNVRNIADATMAVINGHTKMVDVLGIETEDGKSTYALSGLEMGAYRDAEARKKKYWYFGPLKFRWTYLRTAMKQWPPTLKAKISYASQEESDANIKKIVKSVPQRESWSWLHLFYQAKPTIVPTDLDDDSEFDESAMGPETEIDTVEFTVTSSNLLPLSNTEKAKYMSIGLGPSSPKRSELINEGWRRINDKTLTFGCASNEIIQTKRFKFSPAVGEGEDSWFTIDGNHFEATPVDIRLLKNRLSFCIQ